MLANILKGLGAWMLLLGVEPLLAYAVVGIGAATYSPAKYGILPELVAQEGVLMKVNGWIEGSTIVAILMGTVVGAKIADASIEVALYFVLTLYTLSGLFARWMSHLPPAHIRERKGVLGSFAVTVRRLMTLPKARFATLGVSLFWASAVSLRLMMIAWAPVALMLSTTEDISLLSVFIALGIACGALLAPRLIPMRALRRVRFAAYALGLSVLGLTLVDDVASARALLFVAGFCGGLFVVPVNAVLQDIGHRSVGSGHAVAVQHFFENLAMLTATAVYTGAVGMGVEPITAMLVLGLFILAATMLISRRLPDEITA